MPARTIKRKSAPLATNAVGDGVSPALTWDNVPSGTRSFAIVMEDPDVRQNTPFVHWLIYNLPGDMRELPESIPPDSPLTEFGGALQGRTTNGMIGYFGPRPPTEDGAHHYHFELFCLDSHLAIGSGADREQLIGAMAGHALAKGELVGLYEAPVS